MKWQHRGKLEGRVHLKEVTVMVYTIDTSIMHMYWIAQKYRVTVRTESFKFKFVDFMIIKD